MNKVLQGDCLELMRDIPDKSVDMILCDLPYGTTACKWDVIIPFEPLWEQYKRIVKPNAAIVLTGSQPFTSQLVMSNPKWFKYEWIWEKEQGVNPLMAGIQPLKSHENILVFGKEKIFYDPILESGCPYNVIRDRQARKHELSNTVFKATQTINDGFRLPKTIIRFNRETGIHPTQKPVALFEYLIKTYTNEGDLVLDNCAGSGTTAVACLNTNRNYILMEKEQKYIDVIGDRLRQPRQLRLIA